MRAADAAEAHTQGAPEQGSRVAQLVGAEKGQLWPCVAPGPYPEPQVCQVTAPVQPAQLHSGSPRCPPSMEGSEERQQGFNSHCTFSAIVQSPVSVFLHLQNGRVRSTPSSKVS